MKSINFQKILPKGSVLVFSLLILSIMLVTSLTILSSALLNQKASLSTGSSARSFQVADSGVEKVLYEIYKNASAHDNLSDLAAAVGGSCVAPGTIEFPVAGGDARVVFYQDATTVYGVACGTDGDWRNSIVKIKSEGSAGSTTRAVEVAVAASNITCPSSGWTLIGGGGFGSYCIENDERAAQSYDNALTTCGGIQPTGYGYAHLCDDNEWHTACQHPAGLSHMTDNWEWISERDDDANSIFVGNGGCTSDSQGNGNTNFRCCLR